MNLNKFKELIKFMKVKFTTKDEKEIKRLTKSLDMTLALFQITHNTKKSIMYELENKDLKDWEAVDLVFDRIYEILEEYNINIDELIE